MSTLAKITTALTAISFCILLIPNFLHSEFFLSMHYKILLISVFSFDLILSISLLIKYRNGISIVLIFLTGTTAIYLFSNSYDFSKIIYSEKTEQIPDSLILNNKPTRFPDEQLLIEYTKATENAAIAVLGRTENYTIFLLSANLKKSIKTEISEFDYIISQFSAPELEARKTFSAIVVTDKNGNFAAQECLRTIAFFSKGDKIGEEYFSENWQTVDNQQKIEQLK
ncbi:MAG: hypothetical protein LBB41_03715, partial [Prevotellaceae bacterium]|nr:hypothetical protein [Prevotellaceae bacterium]